jgi:hypothetical protein
MNRTFKGDIFEMAQGKRIDPDEVPSANTDEMLSAMISVIAAIIELLEEKDIRTRDKLSARLLELSDMEADRPNISEAISYFEMLFRRPK